MDENLWNERLVARRVTYTIEINNQLIVVENVPARVNLDTGEQLFAPETVERLQRIIAQGQKPKRVMQVPVYEYA